MTILEFSERLDKVYDSYMVAMSHAQFEFRSQIESLMEDSAAQLGSEYSDVIEALLAVKTRKLEEFAEKMGAGE